MPSKNFVKTKLRLMTIEEAIRDRHSVRKYIDKPLSPEQIDILQNKIAEVNNESGLHVQLVVNEPKAFCGRMAYGNFRGVSNYFAMIGNKSDDTKELIGYYGEHLVLLAQTLGLNTCWVALTYNKVSGAYDVADGEKVYCLIALGYGDEPGRKLKRKSVSQVSNADDSTPEWFMRGVEAALLAPTAVNQQKFRFDYVAPGTDGIHHVRASRGFSLIGYTKIDLGIAKCNFEIGAGKENFEWV